MVKVTKRDPVKSFNTLWGSAKSVIGLIKQEHVEAVVKTTDVLIKSLGSLSTIFIDYEGDEFCQGLIFGKDGSYMLVQIASALAQIAEYAENSPLKKGGSGNGLSNFIAKGFNLGSVRPQFG